MREEGVQQQSHIGRTAHSTPATEIIDLTEDEPLPASPKTPLPMNRNNNPSLADHLFRESHSPPPPPELPEVTAEREAVFLRGLNTQWWAGGNSFAAATRSINAALRPGIPQFSKVEGKQRLHSLFAQGKLAIRHELVYHLDCDPGADAPPPKPRTPAKYVSPAQKVLKECQIAELSPHRSLFGGIGEGRFRALELRLESAVRVEKTLFQGGEEGLGRCEEVLNEWMVEGTEFMGEEVRAAFVYLAKQGKVRLEGDVVRLLSLE